MKRSILRMPVDFWPRPPKWPNMAPPTFTSFWFNCLSSFFQHWVGAIFSGVLALIWCSMKNICHSLVFLVFHSLPQLLISCNSLPITTRHIASNQPQYYIELARAVGTLSDKLLNQYSQLKDAEELQTGLLIHRGIRSMTIT